MCCHPKLCWAGLTLQLCWSELYSENSMSVALCLWRVRLTSLVLLLCALTFCYTACNPERIQKEKARSSLRMSRIVQSTTRGQGEVGGRLDFATVVLLRAGFEVCKRSNMSIWPFAVHHSNNESSCCTSHSNPERIRKKGPISASKWQNKLDEKSGSVFFFHCFFQWSSGSEAVAEEDDWPVKQRGGGGVGCFFVWFFFSPASLPLQM